MSTVGKRIRRLRESEGLSQEEFGKIMEVSRSAVSEIEAGGRRISSEELVRLAKAFSLTVDYLLGLQDEPEVSLEGRSLRGATREEIRINVPESNVGKFREVLLYLLNQVGAKHNVGETVVNKLLYFIDFDFYEKYEEQLMGATYVKNHFGPTPVELNEILEQMIAAKEIVRLSRRYFDYDQKKYLPLRAPDLSILDAREITLVDDVLRRLSDMNGSQISEYSHHDIPWQTTEDGGVIDYETVFYRTPEYSVRSYEDDEVP